MLQGRDRKYRFEEASAARDVWVEDGKQPSSLRDRIDQAEADLQERVTVAQSLYGGGMDKSRYQGPPAPEAQRVQTFSTQAELRDERLMLQQQLERCVQRPSYAQQQAVQVSKAQHYQTMVTPASAWELNRELSEASEVCSQARDRLKDARDSINDDLELLQESVNEAEAEEEHLEALAMQAAQRADQARQRAAAVRETAQADEAELRDRIVLAEQAVAAAVGEYDEIKAECDELSNKLSDADSNQESYGDDEERTNYHIAARRQRDAMYGPPGAW